MNISQYLLDPHLNPPTELEKYLFGDCDIFAIAMSKITNYPLYAIYENRVVYENKSYPGLIHCFVCPNEFIFKNTILDAKGYRDINNLKQEYPVHEDCWVVRSQQKDLLCISRRNILSYYISEKELEEQIQETIAFINKHYMDIINEKR